MSTPQDATVVEFSEERGFGTVRLTDGRELTFDASKCDYLPGAGDAVQVTVGPRRRLPGETIVLLQKATTDEPNPPELRELLVAVRSAGIAGGLTPKVFATINNDYFEGDITDASIVDVLDAYYSEYSDAAQSDGWCRYDWRFGQDTDDIVRDLAGLIGSVPLLTFVEWTYRDTTERGHNEQIATLHARDRDGAAVTCDVHSLDDVTALFDAALAAAGDGRRFCSLETDGDWHAYLLLTPDQRLALAALLPFSQIDDLTHLARALARLRSAFGMNARADILLALLTQSQDRRDGVTALALSGVGYGKTPGLPPAKSNGLSTPRLVPFDLRYPATSSATT